MAAPTNNVGSGNIAGTVEDKEYRRQRQMCIRDSQKGVRKMWQPDGRRS